MTTDGLNEYNEKVQQNGNITRVQPQDPTTMRPYLQIWAPGGEYWEGGDTRKESDDARERSERKVKVEKGREVRDR